MQMIGRAWRWISRTWAHLRAQHAVETPPHITFIGETKVGKTSTVNALFRTELEVANPNYDPESMVGHVLSVQAVAIEQVIDTPRGRVLITDMPGLGETGKKTQQYLQVYRTRLPKADVILWILEPDRKLEQVQRHLKAVRTIVSREVFERIVFCLNKVDAIHKGEWISETNQPDAALRDAIQEYISWAERELGLSAGAIIPYSAQCYYNLDGLLEAMMEAIPSTRQAALKQRANPHSPTEKMHDPTYRALGEQQLGTIKEAAREDEAKYVQ